MISRAATRTVVLLVSISFIGPAAEKDFPEGAGTAELLRACTTCHDSQRILTTRYTRAQWTENVARMTNRGVQASDDELDLILEYLVQNFGKNDRVNVNKAEALDLVTGLSLRSKEAQAIIGYRKQHGEFRTVQDLEKVNGIDAQKIEAQREKIEF